MKEGNANKAIVTVVIPVYNGERSIARALDSVIAQTFKDLAIVVVNDGSTDATATILDDYCSRHANIKYFTIPNSGCAKYPRDFGIYHAETRYVVTIDADDYIDSNYIAKLWQRKEATNADVVFGITRLTRDDTDETTGELPDESFDIGRTYDGKDLVKYVLYEWKIGMCGALQDKERRFEQSSYPPNSETLSLSSDEYDSRYMLCQNPRVAFCNAVYHYRINDSSVTKTFSIRQFDSLGMGIKLLRLIESHFNKGSEEHSLMHMQNWGCVRNCLANRYLHSHSMSKEERKGIDQDIERLYKTIDFNALPSRDLSSYLPFALLRLCIRAKYTLRK